ncbi:uncharacterized protein LY79DRAFT_656168 [Colletotrichum navitas]|uniref:Uncharacterized protein n=1 Tax=Colletotrichum navitas TaxID=681940 RepID=A0AAD8QA71_9PEZI|nr:uncharacterized protein LY79DRAFT_656168 [Colletotrichum navitas]KAK1597852.1 hypothetical protein LY79DRAFT_656168 [Colletotrichum navitas]
MGFILQTSVIFAVIFAVALQLVLKDPKGDVSFCSVSSGCKRVSERHRYPNGLVRGRDGLIFVPSAMAGGIQVYRVLPEDEGPQKVAEIPMPYSIDNLSVDGKGDIYAAVFPRGIEILQAIKDPAATVEYAVGCRWRRQMSVLIPDPRFLTHSGEEDLELREESPKGWEMHLQIKPNCLPIADGLGLTYRDPQRCTVFSVHLPTALFLFDATVQEDFESVACRPRSFVLNVVLGNYKTRTLLVYKSCGRGSSPSCFRRKPGFGRTTARKEWGFRLLELNRRGPVTEASWRFSAHQNFPPILELLSLGPPPSAPRNSMGGTLVGLSR